MHHDARMRAAHGADVGRWVPYVMWETRMLTDRLSVRERAMEPLSRAQEVA